MADINVPETMLREVDALVAQGAFTSRDAAIQELLRLGLDAFRARGVPRPPYPPTPPVPPGRRNPDSERPIQPDPTDVNWAP